MRRRLPAALLLLGALVVLLTLLARPDAPSPTAPTPGEPGDDPERIYESSPAPAGIPPRYDQGPPPQPPIIDEIEVEKREVCQGEENLITVRAHTPGHRDDAYLHAVIDGRPGLQVPVRAELGADGSQPEPVRVTVFGRQNVSVSATAPAFRVKDCTVDRKVVLVWRVLPNTEAELEMEARVLDVAASTPFVPASVRWRFGDGESSVTEGLRTTHSYERRDQSRSLFAHYLIEAEVVSETGETAVGRRMLVLQNLAYSNLVHAGVITLSLSLEPRFPVRDDDGVVRQKVHLWHHQPEPVRITRVLVRRNFRDGKAPVLKPIAVTELLPSPSLPPSGVTVSVELDTGAEPDVYSIDYLLEGDSAAGVPVRGTFPLMAPPPLPTPDNSTPVRDPAFAARIRRAQTLLGKPAVTMEEIWALERDGAFDDLPERTEPASPPKYGDMGPHPPRPGEPAADTPLEPGERLPVLGMDPKAP